MTNSPARIAVLASGSGTTAEALILAARRGEVALRVELVIVSRADAGIFERIDRLNKAHDLHIETALISHKTHPAVAGEAVRQGYQTAAEEAAILARLQAGSFDLVACLGYMKHVGSGIVQAFGWQPDYHSLYQAMLVNTHPGLLPDTAAFYGAHIQQYVLNRHLPFAGHSLHVVSDDYDAGPIITEHRVTVEPDDTADSLFARVQASEKQYLPGDLEAFVKNRRAFLSAA